MDLTELLRIAQVVLGIGLVIFVHEAGHFIAARMCKVQVEVFSLGFGPALFAWRRGGTTYQVAAIPLGGFVKMLGDEPTEEGREWARRQELKESEAVSSPSDHRDRSGELGSKSVGQRFFIYSGGVLMNLAFAVIVFPILFARGVPFTRPLVDPAPGGPAWQAGIEPGSRVTSVNGRRVFDFNHIQTAVALGDPQRASLEVQPPDGGEPVTYHVEPERLERFGINVIKVGPSAEPGYPIVVREGSAAHDAGLRTGMQLVELRGASRGLSPHEQLRELVVYGERGIPVEVVARESTKAEPTVFRVEPIPGEKLGPPRVGVLPPSNVVVAVRDNPDLAALGLRRGDVVRSVGETPVRRPGEWHEGLLAAPAPLQVVVERAGERVTLELPDSDGPLDEARRFELARDVALSDSLDGDPAATELVVIGGEPAAEAGLRDGDRVVRIDGEPVGKWRDVQRLFKAAGAEGRSAEVEILRPTPGAESPPAALAVDVEPRSSYPPDYGFGTQIAQYVYRADGPLDAMKVGVNCSIRFVEDTWLTLKRMLVGQVSAKNMGGIIMISQVSYSLSEQGLAKLFFFLCMLSINLAILNVLPIPVLDGGHLFFLLIEKLKGSPVSDRVLGYSNMVGLVLILSLMVYVTYNDLSRLFG